jgi:Uma2 family endonuclease
VSTATVSARLTAMGTSDEPTVRRFTADETVRMVEVGIIGEDETVELLDGVIFEMSSQGPAHAHATATLADRLRVVYRGRAIREEKPLTTGTHNLPAPDIAVVLERAGGYARRHPTGNDAILVVELALSSQQLDRTKASIYAAGGVDVYWLIDLAAHTLEVWTAPVEGAYQVTRLLGEDDAVELPESRSGARWTVRDLLP